MSEQLDAMKSSLMSVAQAQMGDLEHVCAEELGEVIDMIKDIEEAKYYCAITKAMEDRDKNEKTEEKINTALLLEKMKNPSIPENMNYYGGPHVRYPDRRFDEYGRMYYSNTSYYDDGQMYYDGRDMRRGGSSNDGERSFSRMSSIMRDSREGRSWDGRRGYMESKENHMTDAVKMERLNEYMKELGEDITEMIKDSTPQEKSALRDKLTNLAKMVV